MIMFPLAVFHWLFSAALSTAFTKINYKHKYKTTFVLF